MHDKRRQHGIQGILNYHRNENDLKNIIALILIELIAFFYIGARGYLKNYIGISIVLIIVTVISYLIVNYINGNQSILIVTMALLNLGFMIQSVSGIDKSDAIKLVVGVIIAYIVGIFYYIVPYYIWTSDQMAWILTVFQIVMAIAVMLLGTKTKGTDEGAQATLDITIGKISMQPFEFVKIAYILVLAIILFNSKVNRKFLGIIQREIFAIILTLILTAVLIKCNEMGTLLVMYISGFILLLIYSHNRKRSMLLSGLFGGVIAVFWCISEFLYQKVGNEGPFGKVVARFAFALHPERDLNGVGQQGVHALMAIAIGQATGVDSERHILTVSNMTTDMMFSSIIQNCGVIIGIAVIIGIFAIFYQAYTLAMHTKDTYYSIVVMGIGTMIAVECIIHIACNLAMFPITGITLYFVSSGFSSLSAVLMLVAILVVISSKVNQKEGKN